MENLLEKAILRLEERAPIQYNWQEIARNQEIGIDGYLNLILHNENKLFKVLIKKNIRNIHLPDIYALGKIHQNFMIITDNFYPQIFKKLIEHNIGYLDTAGNAYIKTLNNLILIEGKKAKDEYENNNKLFTPIGVKFTYYLLDDENFKYLNYREMAERCETALGNINKIVNKLTHNQFVIKTNNMLRINNKDELFKKWVEAYGNILKPQLFIGKFRFLEYQVNLWKNIILNNKTVWGGEPAANIITNYLKPAAYTVYTNENKADFIKNYRLVPDKNGNIEVYKKFWDNYQNTVFYTDQIAPYIITYADLIDTGDPRNIETAQMIYDRHIKEKL